MNGTPSRTPRILKYLFFGLLVLGLLLMLFINSNLASLAEMLHPGAGLWTHGALLLIEIIALGWFWRGLFRGPRHLLLLDTTNPEKQAAFERELKRRMRSNPYIRNAGLSPHNPDGRENFEYLERCMAVLRQAADTEIQRSAKRVFLATALSQNGRLDALIVFVAVCRLIWRVSSIYNQRPHPSEIMSLYWTVASTTFLAFTIEELDVATEITVGFGEALHAVIPSSFTASIPFAGSVLQTFTASTIDGTANCYLALRAGIITRNAYSFCWQLEKKPSRADVFREAGAQLMGMSQELVGKVATAVASGLTLAAKNIFVTAGDKTVKTGKGIVGGISKITQEIGSSAGKIASGTANGAARIATETMDTVDKLAAGVVDTAAIISSGAEKVISGTVHAASATRSGITTAKEFASGKVKYLTEASSSKKVSVQQPLPAQLRRREELEQGTASPHAPSSPPRKISRFSLRRILGRKKEN